MTEKKELSLEETVTHVLEECRLVLPGMQALFGFQLIAVFNSGFSEKLSAAEQRVHLLAILCVVTAIALVMAPAVIHRSRERRSVSRGFVEVSSRLLMASMAPLALAITLDIYLIARVILGHAGPALLVAAGALLVFATLWAILPARVRLE